MGMYMYNVAWCLSQLTVPEMDGRPVAKCNLLFSPIIYFYWANLYMCEVSIH
jgi:hypothetical protein